MKRALIPITAKGSNCSPPFRRIKTSFSASISVICVRTLSSDRVWHKNKTRPGWISLALSFWSLSIAVYATLTNKTGYRIRCSSSPMPWPGGPWPTFPEAQFGPIVPCGRWGTVLKNWIFPFDLRSNPRPGGPRATKFQDTDYQSPALSSSLQAPRFLPPTDY
jgi:hypothetical protein